MCLPMALKSGKTESKFKTFYSLADLVHKANYLACLCLSFLLYKMRAHWLAERLNAIM